MSSDLLIRTRGLGKAYAIFASPADRLKQMLALGRRKYFKEFWALQDVHFDLRRGETVGIIGRNGSGKSTFLKLLCGVLQPTAGEVSIQGKVMALLELGAGFNPEFTGRENAKLSASLMGIDDGDLPSKLEEIFDFAGIGDYIDQPVRTYSSGMFARLAFSVAAHVTPDILIIDEILAVGDAPFQHKCFGRLNTLKANGCSILVVSHSAETIAGLCDRAVLIHQGKLELDGPPRFVIQSYYSIVLTKDGNAATELLERIKSDKKPPLQPSPSPSEIIFDNSADKPCWFDPALISETALVYPENGGRIENLRLVGPDGNEVNIVTAGAVCTIKYRAVFSRSIKSVLFGFHFRNSKGMRIAGLQIPSRKGHPVNVHAGNVYDVEFPFMMRMTPATYSISAGLWSQDEEPSNLHWVVEGLLINIVRGADPASPDILDLVDLSAAPPSLRQSPPEAPSC